MPVWRIPAATSSFNTGEARAALAVRRPVIAYPGVARGAAARADTGGAGGGEDDGGGTGGGNGSGSRTAVASVSRVGL